MGVAPVAIVDPFSVQIQEAIDPSESDEFDPSSTILTGLYGYEISIDASSPASATGESLIELTVKTKVSKSESSPSLTETVIFAKPLKFSAGVNVNVSFSYNYILFNNHLLCDVVT